MLRFKKEESYESKKIKKVYNTLIKDKEISQQIEQIKGHAWEKEIERS